MRKPAAQPFWKALYFAQKAIPRMILAGPIRWTVVAISAHPVAPVSRDHAPACAANLSQAATPDRLRTG
jgi:hypothetical protein